MCLQQRTTGVTIAQKFDSFLLKRRLLTENAFQFTLIVRFTLAQNVSVFTSCPDTVCNMFEKTNKKPK